MTDLLEVDAVCLEFGGQHVLRDVSFGVGRGEVVALIGPNGAGKTSLINCIMRSYVPSSGRIEFDGVDLLRKPAHALARLDLARTFQNVELLLGATVMDNVLLGLHASFDATWIEALFNLPRSRTRERDGRVEALDALRRVGFSRPADTRVADLPFGHQKLVELARCLVGKPRLLLLDEPVAGLSSTERVAVAELLAAIRAQSDVSMLIVEHDVAFVRSVADRLVALNFGEIAAAGSPDEVLNTKEFRTSFLGEDLAASAPQRDRPSSRLSARKKAAPEGDDK